MTLVYVSATLTTLSSYYLVCYNKVNICKLMYVCLYVCLTEIVVHQAKNLFHVTDGPEKKGGKKGSLLLNMLIYHLSNHNNVYNIYV